MEDRRTRVIISIGKPVYMEFSRPMKDFDNQEEVSVVCRQLVDEINRDVSGIRAYIVNEELAAVLENLPGFVPFGQQETEQTEDYNLYCEVCNSCGHEGCCSPVHCKMSPDGKYCETSLRNLRFGYMMWEELGDYVPMEHYNRVFDKVYESVYGTSRQEPQ